MTLVFDPVTADNVPIAVECKQYRKANNKAFAEALTDYIRGLPAATAILVDYGSVRAATVLEKVPDNIRDRAVVISEFRPDRPLNLDTFRAAVRTRLGLAANPSVLDSIELTWTAPPSDLDLHVTVPTTTGDVELFYENRGSEDTEPYAVLEEDVTRGERPERVTIYRWQPGRYQVKVRQYSDDGSVAAGGAQVTVHTTSESRSFASPALVHNAEWVVCEIDGTTGTILASPS
jgi:hypothetical protein